MIANRDANVLPLCTTSLRDVNSPHGVRWYNTLAVLLLLLVGCRPTTTPAIIPARIVSGSMAPHFYGQHWSITCGDCGHSFDCGIEHPPSDMKAVCPNCGFADNEIDEANILPGMPVEVVPRNFTTDPPRRWEVIAFREPGSDHVAVKRVVGTPGEKVGIRGGDVFVDGIRVQKTHDEFSALAQAIYHPSFHAPQMPPRWRPDGNDSKWKPQTPEPSIGFQCDRSGQNNDRFDWLTYHHISGAAIPKPRFEESRVLDSYAYNQGLSRSLNVVNDLMLSASITMSDGGELRIRLFGGDRPLFVSLVPQENTVSLWHGDQQLIEAPSSTPLGQLLRTNVTVDIVDGQVLVLIDKELTLMFKLDASGQPLELGELALAIGSRGANVEVLPPMVFRDVYYLNPHYRTDDWEMNKPLGEDEYFLLGDNPPNSVDSRQYGPIRRTDIVGAVE